MTPLDIISIVEARLTHLRLAIEHNHNRAAEHFLKRAQDYLNRLHSTGAEIIDAKGADSNQQDSNNNNKPIWKNPKYKSHDYGI